MSKENKEIQNGELASPESSPYYIASMSLHELESVLNTVMGRVLTIAEATVESNKLLATKSLIKEAIWKDMSEINRWHFDNVGSTGNKSTFPIYNRGAVEE
jgi:hypothetical protein